MSRRLFALLVVAVCSCDPKPAPLPAEAPGKTAKAEPAEREPAKAEPPKGDPVLLKVCKAFDEVVAENKPEQDHQILQRTALRATELGVSEAQLEALGPLPPQLLASVRARGNPPECAAYVAYLEALP
jgi:hypothetical protein